MPTHTKSVRHLKSSIFCIGAVCVMVLSCLSPVSAKKRITEAQRDERKADYMFLEALNYQMQNKADAYVTLIERAHQLNPNDPYITMQYGIKLLFEAGEDSVQIENALDMIQRYVDKNPTDYQSAVTYAGIVTQAGNDARALSAWSNLYKNFSDRIEIGGMYADALTKTGDTANIRTAIDIYNDIERMEGINPTTTSRKIRLYGLFRDTAAVKNEMNALLMSSPASSDIAAMAGSLYHQLNDRDSALYYFNRAVELAPNSGNARYQRALFYDAIGDSAKYDAEIFQALDLPDLELNQKLGMVYDYVGKLFADSIQQPRIEAMFQSLVSQYPHESTVRNLYGDYLVTTGNLPQAAEQYSYSLDSDPSDVKRWQQLGSIYYSISNIDKAVETADNAIKYHPEATGLYTMASSICIQNKQFDKAIGYIRKGMAMADSSDMEALSDLNCALADVYYSESAPDSAFIYYQKALDYNPDNALALNNCAYHMACEDKDLDKALKMIKRVVDNSPASSNSLDTYAWIMFKLKDYAKAHELIDGALANNPDPESSAELLEHAGDIYFMDGMPDKAVEFWQKALKLKPDNDLLKRKVKHKTFFYK